MKKFIAAYFLFVALLCGVAIADTITGSLRVSPNITHTGNGSASTLRETIATLQSWDISGTTGAVSLTKMWVQSVSLAGAASTNFDLYGTLTDSFGASVSFTAVKGIAVYAASSNTSSIGVGGTNAAPLTNWVADASDRILVLPSTGFFLFSPSVGGYAVSNGVSDTLTVTNMHATSNAYFDIYIMGLGI